MVPAHKIYTIDGNRQKENTIVSSKETVCIESNKLQIRIVSGISEDKQKTIFSITATQTKDNTFVADTTVFAV